MPDSSQVFLRELDKKLWTAADRLRSNLAGLIDGIATIPFQHANPKIQLR